MENKNQNSFNLESAEKKNVFSVPENYFESLDQKIKDRIVELNPSLKTPVFGIPEGYFKSSRSSINRKISDSSVLDNPVLKESVFKTPEGYFHELEQRVDSVLFHENQKEENIFIIPDHYFETLNEKIQGKIGEKDNVIKFDFISENVVRYAVAASIALVLVASGLFFVFRNQSENQLAQTKANEKLANVLIATLDKNEVSNYLEKQEEVETHEIMEFASEKKKDRIKKDLEREIISASISNLDKQTIELDLNDLDEFEMPTDI